MMDRETFCKKLREYHKTIPVGTAEKFLRDELEEAFNIAHNKVESLTEAAKLKEEQRIRNLPMVGPGSVDE